MAREEIFEYRWGPNSEDAHQVRVIETAPGSVEVILDSVHSHDCFVMSAQLLDQVNSAAQRVTSLPREGKADHQV